MNVAETISSAQLISLRAEAKTLGWDWVVEICTQALEGSEPHRKEAARLRLDFLEA